jgi:hypothetical protein
MPRLIFYFFILLFPLAPLHAQTVWQFFSAREYLEMPNGPEKSARIRDLEYDGWKKTDTLIDFQQQKHVRTVDLAPYVDSMGNAVFLVPEVSPEFPGGAASLQDFWQNYLGDILARPDEGVQNSVYIKFVVQTDGSIGEVAPAQPMPDWIPAGMPQRCLDAVRQMPPWTPGQYRGRPVKVVLLAEMGLR